MPDAPTDTDRARERLRVLAGTRREQMMAAEALAQDVRLAVKTAQGAGVPLAEVARLLDMDRSTLYRTYLNGSGGS